MNNLRFVVDDLPEGGLRVDRYVMARLDGVTRSQLKARSFSVLLNGNEVKPSRKIKPGDIVEVRYDEPVLPTFEPEAMELSILYEDDRVLVVDKPAGVVVHPGNGVSSGTLVQGLLHHVVGLGARFQGDRVRPGIVHRLDKDTSGVIIAAKDPVAHEFLSQQFRHRTTRKVYLAIVKGRPKVSRGCVEGFICRDPANRKRFMHSEGTGKQAETRYRMLKEWEGCSLLVLEPRTGRTHQLRVHMKALGCPILGDPVYGKPDKQVAVQGLLLHAWRLAIALPVEPDGPREFRAPLPRRFKEFMRRFAGDRR
jgi:23S rRNA pseudouridine1911/1915/1917 synthase